MPAAALGLCSTAQVPPEKPSPIGIARRAARRAHMPCPAALLRRCLHACRPLRPARRARAQVHAYTSSPRAPGLPASPQWLHRMEVGITRGAEGKTGRAFVANMTEEKAVELASKVASEGFIYGVSWRQHSACSGKLQGRQHGRCGVLGSAASGTPGSRCAVNWRRFWGDICAGRCRRAAPANASIVPR